MLVGFVENLKFLDFFEKNLYLLFRRISSIRQNYWPDIRPNQYPVQPYTRTYSHENIMRINIYNVGRSRGPTNKVI